MVFEAASAWRRFAEEQPLRFIDRQLFPYLVQTTKLLAGHVGARPTDIALLPNVTTGLNAVLHSAVIHATCRGQSSEADEDGVDLVVFSLDVGYGAAKKIIKAATDLSTRCRWVEIALPLPATPDEICKRIEERIGEYRAVSAKKLAVIDYITSNTALVLPVNRLIDVFHRHSTLVLVDAAHALGVFDLRLDELNADFFTSNCHKWFLCPRGAAFLWVKQEHQSWVRPPIISHGAESGFISQFIWDGARDYSAVLSIGTALLIWQRIGPLIRRYQTELMKQATRLLTERWRTDCLFSDPSQTGTMQLVRLPDEQTRRLCSAGEKLTSAHSKAVQDQLHHRHAIEVPVKLINDRLYVRISVHIYNSLDDFAELANAVINLWTIEQQAARL